MAFDFPASPTNGQSFTPAGGKPYVWDGVAWRMSGAGITTSVIIADTPPAGVAHGTLWWEADSGNTFIFYDDGDSKQWVQFNVSSAPANVVTKTAEPYNRLVNGSLLVSQENGRTATGVDGTYPADQWVASFAASGATFGTATTAGTGLQSPFYASVYSGTAKPSLAAGDLLLLTQGIEGLRLADLNWGTASAVPIVVQFCASCDTPGTYAFTVRNGASNRSYVAPVALDATVRKFTIAIPGDTTGTWVTDNTRGMTVGFALASGTTYQTPTANQWLAGNFLQQTGMASLLSAGSKAFTLSKVGLYLDPDATGKAPPWTMPDFAAELAACQRYYVRQPDVALLFHIGQRVATDVYRVGSIPLFPPMRVAPSVVVRGVAGTPPAGPFTTDSTTPVNISVAHNSTNTTTTYYIVGYTANARM
jgi:hypothetical protein